MSIDAEGGEKNMSPMSLSNEPLATVVDE